MHGKGLFFYVEEILKMVLALVLFVIMYVLLLLFPRYRPWIALGTALIFVILGIMPLEDILGSINFNVLMMIAGTMGIVSLFIESGMPSLMDGHRGSDGHCYCPQIRYLSHCHGHSDLCVFQPSGGRHAGG